MGGWAEGIKTLPLLLQPRDRQSKEGKGGGARVRERGSEGEWEGGRERE